MAAAIEAPRMNNRCLPRGAVAIVSINPVASVAALEDEQATLEASALPSPKCLAIVDSLHGFDWSKPVYDMPLGLSFFCVGRGLPDPPAASLALALDAPLGNDRQPLVIDPPLPWPDCYVYTVECFYARISRVYPCTLPRTPTVMTEEQWVTVNSSVTRDQMSANLPLRDAYGDPIDVPDDEYDTDNEPCYDVEGGFVRAKETGDDGVHGKAAAVGDEQQAGDKVEALGNDASDTEQSEAAPTRDPYATWPQLEVWLDLTSTTEFDQPATLLQTLRRLTIIVHESNRRKAIDLLAKRPMTMQWADDVAAAEGAADLERPNESAPGQVVEDTTIAPEDAIEHRQERAAAQSAPLPPVQPSPTPISTAASTNKPAKKRLKLSLIGVFSAVRMRLRRLGRDVMCTGDAN